MSVSSTYYKHYQADMLAAAILMPKEETLRIWHNSFDVEVLAEIFEVPLKCAFLRLEMLGIKYE